ncbi:Similar to hypothetical protein [Tuber melanosporum Mel28]; acc. no. XP_002840505 [Pyronema omphalodes CBS 100304]|uniref:Uncharacterized protein n=1 Tax=Pyronema omphalodes (strain CBS 100304) TaxID=1076935 RepID=U4LUN0_PYROM|nr:Similar to hypothetical protein [Tuber melanosporum Mel28]; acc. no. XP_002840505 [Pyronema omphalodes CBS 100304]
MVLLVVPCSVFLSSLYQPGFTRLSHAIIPTEKSLYLNVPVRSLKDTHYAPFGTCSRQTKSNKVTTSDELTEASTDVLTNRESRIRYLPNARKLKTGQKLNETRRTRRTRSLTSYDNDVYRRIDEPKNLRKINPRKRTTRDHETSYTKFHEPKEHQTRDVDRSLHRPKLPRYLVANTPLLRSLSTLATVLQQNHLALQKQNQKVVYTGLSLENTLEPVENGLRLMMERKAAEMAEGSVIAMREEGGEEGEQEEKERAGEVRGV